MEIRKISILLYLIFFFVPSVLFDKNNTCLAAEVGIEEKFNENLDVDLYLLGPGDVINLTFLSNEKLSGKYKVLNNGQLILPLINATNVKNLSLISASQIIKEKYSKELIDPELYITIEESRPIKVSVIGEVSTPGLYKFPDNSSTSNNSIKLPTVVDAIQNAGGITPKTNLKSITLIRRLSGKEERFKKTNLNLLDLVIQGDQNQNPFLLDGDIVKLEEAKDISSINLEATRSNINPEFIEVSVIGKVYNPGTIKVKPNTPLIQAILKAGGPINWKANKGNIQLVRLNENGTVSLKSFRLDLAKDTSQKYNPILKEGDIVKISPSALNSFSEGVATVTEPLGGFISVLSIFKLLQ